MEQLHTYLLALFRRNAHDCCGILVQHDCGNAGKHLFEVFLQTGQVFAVSDDLKQILVSHKVESTKINNAL